MLLAPEELPDHLEGLGDENAADLGVDRVLAPRERLDGGARDGDVLASLIEARQNFFTSRFEAPLFAQTAFATWTGIHANWSKRAAGLSG